MTEQELINAVRAHALVNCQSYGWDTVADCWMDGDILEAINGAETSDQAIANVGAELEPHIAMRKAIQAAGSADEAADAAREFARMHGIY